MGQPRGGQTQAWTPRATRLRTPRWWLMYCALRAGDEGFKMKPRPWRPQQISRRGGGKDKNLEFKIQRALPLPELSQF